MRRHIDDKYRVSYYSYPTDDFWHTFHLCNILLLLFESLENIVPVCSMTNNWSHRIFVAKLLLSSELG